jgi:hypothetical protein
LVESRETSPLLVALVLRAKLSPNKRSALIIMVP